MSLSCPKSKISLCLNEFLCYNLRRRYFDIVPVGVDAVEGMGSAFDLETLTYRRVSCKRFIGLVLRPFCRSLFEMLSFSVSTSLRKGVSAFVAGVLITVSSFVALAGDVKPVGDITVRGKDGVMVNGEPVETGRTIFAGSTITTGEGSGAVLNIEGKGRIELGANSTFTVGSGDDAAAGQVVSGSAKLVNGTSNVSLKNAEGSEIAVNTGETVSATAGKSAARDQRDKDGKCIDTNNDGKLDCYEGLAAWGWILIAAGVGAAVILAVALSDDDNRSVSPVR